ncbi:testis-expressed protein 45 [Terrapene carolina triunguis]|uniref:testis-expressed protein 45 n=1 Tax=Terrapene triunguis TaxID=2587831 RepID=UPI000E777459|nr:testis-expressed protein 45 [Terrapene carolina triunguis]
MAATGQSLIPAPLTGIPFLKASHFQIGFDHRPQGNVVESPFRTDFPPLWGSYKPDPILLPNSKGVLNQDMDKARETWSETHLAFPVRSLEPKPKVCPPESHLQMHADSQTKIFTSTARESYPWPDVTLQGPASTRADYNKEEDHFPCGDKDKLKLLPSVYRFSYPAYEIFEPIAKAPCVHLGGIPTIKGDRCSYYGTSYQAQFEGGWIPPVKSCGKSKSSIVFGDPRSSVSTSEEKRAYALQDTRNHRVYDKECAAFQIHKTNIKPGDGRTRFFTVTLESFPRRELGKGTVTTTQAMLVPHRQWMLRPSEESLQQIKYSHLVPPWQGQRFFGTEHQDEFTPKYSGPVTICGGNFQVSSVPLGTLKKYNPQRRMVFAT